MDGPWQAFERDIARLLLVSGFEDVRLVGGSGDHGADVLGVLNGKLWLVQCKFSAIGGPSVRSIDEVVEAGRYYKADKLMIASSRRGSEHFFNEIDRRARFGPHVEVVGPRELLHLVTDAPEYAPSYRTARDYQEEAVVEMRESLLATGRAQVVLATGLGKTIVMADLVTDLISDGFMEDGSILVLAHTRELVDQLQRAFWHQLPSWVATHQLTGSETPSHWQGITFATVQTVFNRDDELPHFDLVLIDEAHHIGSNQYQNVIRQLDPPMLAGVTATPWRGDNFDIDYLLGPALVRYGIAEGLQRGYLSDVDYRLMADDLDWEEIQDLSKHRYSIAQLNRKLIIPVRDMEAARLIRTTMDDESRHAGIVFSPTLEHADHFAAALRQFDLRAAVISGEQPPRERDTIMAAFKAGHYDLMVTVDLFNEGVDLPDVDLIAFMRVTHSRRIFVQQLGRGLRVSPGKDKLIVLDFVTDLRRVAEVIELDRATRNGQVEHLGLGNSLMGFRNATSGDFLREWMLDQASLFLREDDAQFELPMLEFPFPIPPGSVQ